MTFDEAFAIIGIAPFSLEGCTTIDQAKQRLAEWKAGPLAKRRRELAKLHHPDLGADDEAEERTARMAQVNAAHDFIVDKLEVRVVRPRRVLHITNVGFRHGFASGATSTAAAGAGADIFPGWPVSGYE